MKQLKIAQIWAGKLIALLFCMTACQFANAQQSLPIIRANTKTVDVKDGTVFQKSIWNLAPEIKPDIYHKIEPEIEQKVTFYTDIDSISFEVKPS